MDINTVFHTYFNSCSIMQDPKASGRDKCMARACVVSYFLVVPPILFALGYALTRLCRWTWKVSFDSIYPKISGIAGLFVEVLNKRGYVLNGKKVTLPYPETAKKYDRQGTLEESIKRLRETFKDTTHFQLKFENLTTEDAIVQSNGFTIALNFANETYAGGNPRFHWDKDKQEFVYDGPSSPAQEESIVQRSTLMASLAPLTDVCLYKDDLRSQYKEPFDSRVMAYVSDNHLFAVPDGAFHSSRYLDKPKAVCFITSAACCYRERDAECSKDSEAYKDARARIETHLLAAASRAVASKKERPELPVELILGAFGCGAFVPYKNKTAYRKMIAQIYREVLPSFHGFFDVVTFAVPSFGKPNDPNYTIFKDAVKNFEL